MEEQTKFTKEDLWSLIGRDRPPPRAWIAQIFESDRARNGKMVRRSVESVEQNASLTELDDEARYQGWRVVRQGDDYLIIPAAGGAFEVV